MVNSLLDQRHFPVPNSPNVSVNIKEALGEEQTPRYMPCCHWSDLSSGHFLATGTVVGTVKKHYVSKLGTDYFTVCGWLVIFH